MSASSPARAPRNRNMTGSDNESHENSCDDDEDFEGPSFDPASRPPTYGELQRTKKRKRTSSSSSSAKEAKKGSFFNSDNIINEFLNSKTNKNTIRSDLMQNCVENQIKDTVRSTFFCEELSDESLDSHDESSCINYWIQEDHRNTVRENANKHL